MFGTSHVLILICVTNDQASTSRYQPFECFSAWAEVGVGTAWAETLAALRSLRDVATEDDWAAAVQYALRAAALESGAIEGLYATSRGVTRSVALQAAAWQAELDKLGSDVRGHFEAQLAAFEMVLDAATKAHPITEAWLRELHAAACAGQQTYRALTEAGWQDQALQHGAYKTHSNNVGRGDGTTHWYASPDDVKAEMHRLVTEMGSDEFGAAHPVLQAAYAHHALTAVHPFADGNGRVARALASVFLYRAAGVPLVIFSDQQEQYWDALADADAGRTVSFVRFIDDRAIDTTAMVTDRLHDVRNPLESQAAALRSLFTAHGGLTLAQVQAVGFRLSQHLQARFGDQFEAVAEHLRPDVHGQVYPDPRPGARADDFEGWPYHHLADFTFMLRCYQPSEVIADIRVVVGAANDVDEHFAFMVADPNHKDVQPLRLRVSDLHPAISSASETRIDSWVRQALNNALGDLGTRVRASLERQASNPK